MITNIHYKKHFGLQCLKKGFFLYLWSCQVKKKIYSALFLFFSSAASHMEPDFAPEESLEIDGLKRFNIGLKGEILILGSAFII